MAKHDPTETGSQLLYCRPGFEKECLADFRRQAAPLGVEGYFKTMMSPLLRVILAAGGLMLIIPELVTDVVGIVLVGIVLTLNVLMAKREQTARPAA
mgnify:CR=1 FL=1